MQADLAPLTALVAALPVRCEAVVAALLAGGEVGTLLPHEETIAHALLAAGLVERDADGMRLWVMGEVDRLNAATHQGGLLDWLRDWCGIETVNLAARVTPGDDAMHCLKTLYAFKRATLGREPTLGELDRWASTYEAVGAALRQLAAFARADGAAPVPTKRAARKAGTPRHKPKALGGKPGAWDTTRVRPKPGAPTAEQVLAKRPLAPPGRVAR